MIVNLLYAKGWQRKGYGNKRDKKFCSKKFSAKLFTFLEIKTKPQHLKVKIMTQRKTDPGKGFLRGQVILIYLRDQSHMRTVYFMNHYFCANVMQFKFNLLQMEQVDSQLTSLVS